MFSIAIVLMMCINSIITKIISSFDEIIKKNNISFIVSVFRGKMVVRQYEDELKYLEKINDYSWRIKIGFQPNMKVL